MGPHQGDLAHQDPIPGESQARVHDPALPHQRCSTGLQGGSPQAQRLHDPSLQHLLQPGIVALRVFQG